jgi:GNAT superfamily N-acetyltransferase
LEKRGFHSNGVVADTRAYDLKARDSEPVILPPGLRIVNMVECTDFRAKGQLFVNGFEDQPEVSELNLLKFEYSRESPAYDPYFDLSVVTQEGLHVATCAGFNDPACGVAEIEKVCTHHLYRRQGLAEAVIQDCFQRLKRCGIERAYISGYSDRANDLYEKLGPCAFKQWFHYELTTG